jgi:hypothetical protein
MPQPIREPIRGAATNRSSSTIVLYYFCTLLLPYYENSSWSRKSYQHAGPRTTIKSSPPVDHGSGGQVHARRTHLKPDLDCSLHTDY